MTTMAELERERAAQLPPGSVIAVLLEQHAQIRDLFAATAAAHGAQRLRTFDALRELLAVHEAGEEIVVRPVSASFAGARVADARNEEEKRAAELLAELEKLEVDSEEFVQKLTTLELEVSDHAEAEEGGEFPYLIVGADADQQLKMGSWLLKVQKAAPTHPHPSSAGSTGAQMVLGPFAALLDRARDAFQRATADRDDEQRDQ